MITWLSSAKRGLIVDEGENAGNMRLAEQFPHTNGQLQVRSTSVLAHSSNGLASLGVQQPIRVSKDQAKVLISDKLLDERSGNPFDKGHMTTDC